jgi:hypothetical protein
MATRIELQLSWGGIPNSHPWLPPSESIRSPLGQLRNQLRGFDQRQHSQGLPFCQDDQDFLITCPWTHAYGSLPMRTLYLPEPGLSWATWIRGQAFRPGQLRERHAFNMTRKCSKNQSLIDTDRDRSTPKTFMPCCFTIVIPPGLIWFHFINTWFFSTIANIANRAIYKYP